MIKNLGDEIVFGIEKDRKKSAKNDPKPANYREISVKLNFSRFFYIFKTKEDEWTSGKIIKFEISRNLAKF